jgi:hypothetical protein
MATEITAKGDLIVGTGSATFDNLAAGANGETLVADSAATTGLRYQGNFSGGKNLAYNSNFDIWQRGTSFTATGYSADRWYASVGGTATVSQESTVVPTGSTYSAKVLTGAASSYAQLYQAFEAQDVNDWCGQTITLSAYVRALASFSGSANIRIFTNTTANTMTGGTWTLQATGTITPSTSQFDRVSVSYAVPAGTKGIKVELNFTSAQASGTGLYWAQTQLEIGSVATAYSRGSATLQGELAACLRYFQVIAPAATYQDIITGASCDSTIYCRYPYLFPTPMRGTPTCSSTGTASDYANLVAGGLATASAVPAFYNIRNTGVMIAISSSAITTGQGTCLRNTTTTPSQWLTFSAEL